MASMRRFAFIDFLMLLLVLAVAGGLRAGYLMTCADGSRSSGPLRVQESAPARPDAVEGDGVPKLSDQEQLIHNVKNHAGFVSVAPFSEGEEATAHVAPGYPYLVGLLGQQVAENALDSYVRWIQLGLGTLTAGLYYLFARRAFRSLLVGTLAGLFAAAHPYWIVSTATLDDGVLASFALAGCLFLGSQAGEKGGALTSLLLGLALGATPLVRAAMLPFAFVALIWFLLRSRSLPSSWLCGLLSFLGFLIALAPWTVRNYQVYEEPVTVVTSAYYHLWVGNNKEATGGPVTPAMLATVDAGELRKTEKQPERYAKLGRAVSDEVRERPVESLRRRLWSALAFFVGDQWLRDGTLAEWTAGEDGGPAWLRDNYRVVLQAVLLAMLMLAFLGWRWSYAWHYESILAMLAMVWVPLPYILSHAEALSGPRLPLDGVLLCYAAFALVGMVPGLNGGLLEPSDSGPRRAV